MASTRPVWSSEMTSCTLVRPRAMREPKKRQSAGPVLSGGHVDTEDLSVSFSVDTGGH